VYQVLDYDHEKDRYLVGWKGYRPEANQWEPAAHLRNAPDKTADYWQHRSLNSSVTIAFWKANEENSRMKRTSIHSRLIQHTPADFFCPSDDRDGEAMEDEEASFHFGGEE
jgi:hypothetical protein